MKRFLKYGLVLSPLLLCIHKLKFQLFIFMAVAFMSYGCLVPEKTKTVYVDSTHISTEPSIDSVLANRLGADEYGMKMYVIAILKKGRKRWMIDSITANRLQKAHLENIAGLANEGKLVVAGSFLENTDFRGIYIFDVKTVAEAQQLCSTDPAIKAQSLTMEFHLWYSSAALSKINEIHKTIAKKNPW